MNLADARIGYAAYSQDFSVPGDRRRFSAYAEQRGLSYEYARLDRDYDVVILTYRGDIPGWIERKRREGGRLKLIFELIDSYLTQRNPLRRYAKGVGRFLESWDSRLAPDLMRTLRTACRETDAVLCSTLEQKLEIARLNSRVFVSFDWFGRELGIPKMDYSGRARLRLVWEGQAATLSNLQQMREPLNMLRDDVELHVVTDASLPRYLGRFGRRPALEVLKGIECPVSLYPWDIHTFSHLITEADVAVIPIDENDPMMRGKPENKLVLLWKLGMPVLTGASPAYRRAMGDAGLPMTCETSTEWHDQLVRLLGSSGAERSRVGRQGRAHAERHYSREAFGAIFDEAFSAAGFRIA